MGRASTLAILTVLGHACALRVVEAACGSSRAFGSGSTSFRTPGQPFSPDADFPYSPYGGGSASGCCEGSYGLDAHGLQRPAGQSVCNDTLFYGTCSAP